MMFADLDPFIAIAIAIGWAIVSAFFRKKKDADEWAEWDKRETKPGPQTLDPFPMPFPQLGKPKPPPPREEPEGPQRELSHVGRHAEEAMAQAHREQERARERLKQLADRVRPTAPAVAHIYGAHPILQKLRRREGIREAVVASVILGPPKALEN